MDEEMVQFEVSSADVPVIAQSLPAEALHPETGIAFAHAEDTVERGVLTVPAAFSALVEKLVQPKALQAARNAHRPARYVSGYALVRVLTEDQIERAKAKDLWRLAARGQDLVPENGPLATRLAADIGLTCSDWFDAASKAQ